MPTDDTAKNLDPDIGTRLKLSNKTSMSLIRIDYDSSK